MSHNAQVYDRLRLLFTVEEAAEHLRCSRRTVERLIARGDLVRFTSPVAGVFAARTSTLTSSGEESLPHERRRGPHEPPADNAYLDTPTLAAPTGESTRCRRGHVDSLVWRPGRLVPICVECLREFDEALAQRRAA